MMVGSLILGRTMRDNRDDDEADAAIGAVAVAPPSSVLHASPSGVSKVGSPESTSFSGDAASALGVSSPPISTSAAQAAVPKRKFSLVLCFWTCLMCATRMASELPTGVPRCNQGGTVKEIYTLVTWVQTRHLGRVNDRI